MTHDVAVLGLGPAAAVLSFAVTWAIGSVALIVSRNVSATATTRTAVAAAAAGARRRLARRRPSRTARRFPLTGLGAGSGRAGYLRPLRVDDRATSA